MMCLSFCSEDELQRKNIADRSFLRSMKASFYCLKMFALCALSPYASFDIQDVSLSLSLLWVVFLVGDLSRADRTFNLVKPSSSMLSPPSEIMEKRSLVFMSSRIVRLNLSSRTKEAEWSRCSLASFREISLSFGSSESLLVRSRSSRLSVFRRLRSLRGDVAESSLLKRFARTYWLRFPGHLKAR